MAGSATHRDIHEAMTDNPLKIEARQKCPTRRLLLTDRPLRGKRATAWGFRPLYVRGSKRPDEQPYLAHRSRTTFRFPGASAVIAGLREDEGTGA